MNTYCAVFALLTVFFASNGFSQQKASKPRTKAKTLMVLAGERSIPDPVPRLRDFALITTLDSDGRATVAIQVDEISPGLQADDVTKIYRRLSAPQTQHANPIIIVKPDPSITYEKLGHFVGRVRDYGENKIRIETTNGRFIIAPAKRKKERDIKPNPLFLELQVSQERDLSVNNEPTGNLSDLSILRNFLARIFQARAENGVFREGTNEVDTDVYMNLPSTLSFSNICKLDEALRLAGSDRIFLLLDTELPTYKRKIIEIQSNLR